MRIVCVGEITIDRYVHQGIETVGGTSLNVAVHAGRCAAEVALVSCVGDDEGGRRALEHLRRARVDASHVAMRSGATAHQDILVAPGGERVFPPGGYGVGVLADWSLSADDLAFIATHDVVVAPYFRQVAHVFWAAMGDWGLGMGDWGLGMGDWGLGTGKRAWDGAGFRGPSPNPQSLVPNPLCGSSPNPLSPVPNPRYRVADFLDWGEIGAGLEVLERAAGFLDIAFVSGDEGSVAALRPLARVHPRCLIVVTLGAAGSVALLGEMVVRQAAIPVAEVVDTTGCGDAFGAACTVAYLTNGDIKGALAAGAQQAARVIGGYGAS